jgi:DNA-binding NarL/FixJ family response regulator
MKVKTKLKIYLLAKNNFVRQGLIELVQKFPRINEIEGIESKKQLVKLISISKPDLVIIDFDVQLIDGFEICEYIISHSIESKILVISQYEDEDTILKLMEMGVHGYLLKTTSPAELEKALYSICDNDIYRNDLVVNVLLNNRTKKKLSSSKELTIHSDLNNAA